jgi:hypothetical protein
MFRDKSISRRNFVTRLGATVAGVAVAAPVPAANAQTLKSLSLLHKVFVQQQGNFRSRSVTIWSEFPSKALLHAMRLQARRTHINLRQIGSDFGPFSLKNLQPPLCHRILPAMFKVSGFVTCDEFDYAAPTSIREHLDSQCGFDATQQSTPFAFQVSSGAHAPFQLQPAK